MGDPGVRSAARAARSSPPLRHFVAALLFVVPACGSPGPPKPTPIVVGSAKGPTLEASPDDLERARAQVLEALDTGAVGVASAGLRDLEARASRTEGPPQDHLADAMRRGAGVRALAAAVKSLSGPTGTTLFANVTPVRVGRPPRPSPTSTRGTLVATRAMGPKGEQSTLEAQVSGRHYASASGQPLGAQTNPPFLPAKLGEDPLRRARASNGRWLAFYGERWIAIVEPDGRLQALIDFVSWMPEDKPGERMPLAWAELADDTLFVSTQGMAEHFIAAIDVKANKVLWLGFGSLQRGVRGR